MSGLRRDLERHQVDQGTTHDTRWALEFTPGDKGASSHSPSATAPSYRPVMGEEKAP